jgi:hypothetical protein
LSPSLLPTGIRQGAPATLFLDSMATPRHGKLHQCDNQEWQFFPGKSNVGISLPDLLANCQQLLDSGQLFKGHTKFKNVYDARTQLGLRDCVLRHVTAHGLHSLIAPTSLKAHNKMDPNDKAYDEEYDDLNK